MVKKKFSAQVCGNKSRGGFLEGGKIFELS